MFGRRGEKDKEKMAQNEGLKKKKKISRGCSGVSMQVQGSGWKDIMST